MDPLSPFTAYKHYAYNGDSDIFLLAGKVWAEGGIPYLDYWDHKGPLIFFVNMTGWLLTNSINGMFFIDAALMLATMLFTWLTVKLLVPQEHRIIRLLSIWTVMVFTIALMYPYFDMTETLCLPFQACALWIMVKNVKACEQSGTLRVWKSTAYLQGLGFAAMFLTRVTNAITICAFTLVLAVVLVMHRQWKNLAVSVGLFIVGFLTLTVPFSVYFAMHGAFGEFVYGTLTYNLSYAGGGGMASGSSASIIAMIQLFSVPTMATLCAALFLAKERRFLALPAGLLISGMLFLVLLSNSEPFTHYAASSIVLIPLIIDEVRSFISIDRIIALLLTAGILMMSTFTAITYQHRATWPSLGSETVERYVEQSNGSVALYNILSTMYLRYDLKPVYRYANLQDWQARFSEEQQQRLLDEYDTAKAEYIILSESEDMTPTIQPVLDEKYQLIETVDEERNGTLHVYQRLDDVKAGE